MSSFLATYPHTTTFFCTYGAIAIHFTFNHDVVRILHTPYLVITYSLLIV
jgi:hypothetical protein